MVLLVLTPWTDSTWRTDFVPTLRPTSSPGELDLDRALRMPSGVMSTRDRMLARAGLEEVTLEAAEGPEGVAGVPVDDGAGLAAEGTREV